MGNEGGGGVSGRYWLEYRDDDADADKRHAERLAGLEGEGVREDE